MSNDEQFLSVWELSKLLIQSKGEIPEQDNIINEARHWIQPDELSQLTEWDIKPGALDGIDEAMFIKAHYIRMDSAFLLCFRRRKPAELLRQKVLNNLSLFVRRSSAQVGTGSQDWIELESVNKKQLKGVQDKRRTKHFIEWVRSECKYDGSQGNYWLQDELRKDNPQLWGKNESTFNKWLQKDEAREARELIDNLKMNLRQKSAQEETGR